VTAAKIHLKEQALDAGTKQSSQAGQHNSQACLLCFGCACFVLSSLLELYLPSGFCTNQFTLSNLLFIDIYEVHI
jgi:hypothetical protein